MAFETFSVVLVEPKYDGNVGAVARVMKNFGFRNLVLIKPPPLGKEARAMAMRGRDLMENALVLDDVKSLKKKFNFLVATTAVIAGDHNPMRTPVFPEQLANALGSDSKIALVFGREDNGLNNDEIELCDLIVSIPADGAYPTLNVAQSVCVVLYEISKQSRLMELKMMRKFQEPSGETKEILLEKFGGLVDLIYDHEFENMLAKKTFKHIVGRAFVSGREAFTLIGLFRQTAEKINMKKEKK